jgi:hypothetical protein
MNHCNLCGSFLDSRRLALGYKCCLECGEEQAREARNFWCVAPLHKSNYVLVTDKKDLTGLNNKGGLVK